MHNDFTPLVPAGHVTLMHRVLLGVVVVLTGERYYFVFEKWFAVEKGDGKVEREVMAADRGLGFSKVPYPPVFIAHCLSVCLSVR